VLVFAAGSAWAGEAVNLYTRRREGVGKGVWGGIERAVEGLGMGVGVGVRG